MVPVLVDPFLLRPVPLLRPLRPLRPLPPLVLLSRQHPLLLVLLSRQHPLSLVYLPAAPFLPGCHCER